MANANYVQTSFLGGCWSPFAQGRADQPAYHTALSKCINGLPVEEGAWVRRTGTQRIVPTYARLAAKLLAFASSTTCAFMTETTTTGSGAYMRLFSGALPIFTNDPRTISVATLSAGALSLTLDANHGWAVGDQFMFSFDGAGLTGAQEGLCRGRVFTAGTAATTHLTLYDDVGNPLVLPALPSGALVGSTVLRIVRLTGPWTTAIDKLRAIQAETNQVYLSALQPPQTLTVVEPTGSNDPVFTLAATVFVDGPYLDPQPGGGTVSAYTGSITWTPLDGTTFTSADVGRHIRLFSEPAAWNSGSSYAYGAYVKYNNVYWQSIAAGAYASSNTGVTPGTPLTTAGGLQVVLWAPAPNQAQWAWGKITAQASTSCTVLLVTDLLSANGSAVLTWQLGVFKVGTYPICGTYHGGRLWLAGAVPNRFDGSVANEPFTFSPTDVYGNVNDDNAIAYTLNSKELENILWMSPEQQGIVVGTLAGEWIVSASTLSDPLTPTSIDARRTTKYGSLEHEPVYCGMALIFIQKFGRRLMEYLSDTFSGRYSGRHLNEFSKHYTVAGAIELAYQEENTPIIWVRTNAGQLIGCTYRRVSRFVSEAPVFSAWHEHEHGGGCTFNSMCMVPAEEGLDDRLYLNAIDSSGEGWIEILRPLPEVDDVSAV